MALTPIEESQLLEHLENFNNPHETTISKSGLQTTDDLPEGLVNLYAQVGGLIYIEGAAPYQDIINLPNPQDGELWVSTTDDTSANVSAGDGILYDEDTDVWTDIGPLQGPQGIPGPRGPKGDSGKPIHHTRLLRQDTDYDYYGLWLDSAETEFIGEYAVKQSEGGNVPPGSDAEITINTLRNLVGGGTFQLNQENDESFTIRHAILNTATSIPFNTGVGIKTVHLDNGHITSIEKQSCDGRYYLKGGDRLTGPMDAGNQYIFNVQTNLSEPLSAVNVATLHNYIDTHIHEISDITNLAIELDSKINKSGGTFTGSVSHGNNELTEFKIPTDFTVPEVQRWPVAIGSIYGLLDDYLPRDGSLGMAGHLSMTSEDEHGTIHSYHIYDMEQPSDLFDGTASDWAASIGLVADEVLKYFKHDGTVPLSGTMDANTQKITNLSADFTDPDTNAANIGLISNHDHPMSAIIDLDDEFLKHYQKVEYLEAPSGGDDADKPIKLGTDGKIDSGFITVSVFHYKGNWTPTTGTEYPDTTGGIVGWFWNIDGVDTTLGYEFTTGDLVGETCYNGDLIILKEVGPDEWVLRTSSIDPNMYLPLSGGTMSGNISMGNNTITNILEDTSSTSVTTRGSVVLLDGSNIMTGNLKLQKETPAIYFDDTGSVNPNTWGYGVLNGLCTIHIKLSDSSTEAKFTIYDDAKLLELKTDGAFYDGVKLLDDDDIIDADTLQTHPASDFALVGHTHTDYVNKAGDRMSGDLFLDKNDVLIVTSKGDTAETDSWIKGFYFLDNSDVLYGGLGTYGSLDTHNYQFWGVGDTPHEHGLRLYDDETFFLNANEIYHTGNLDLSGYAPIDHTHSDYVLKAGDSMTGSLRVQNNDNYSLFTINNPVLTADGTNHLKALYANCYDVAIPSGITDSGYRIALDASCYFNSMDFLGNLDRQYAIWCRHGHNADAGGHITNSYGIYIDSLESGSTVIDNLYAIYQDSTNALNRFNGPIESLNDTNASGPNILVNTTSKDPSHYALEVQRSGTTVGGINLDGKSVRRWLNQNGVAELTEYLHPGRIIAERQGDSTDPFDLNLVVDGGIFGNYGSPDYWLNKPSGMSYGSLIAWGQLNGAPRGQIAISTSPSDESTTHMWVRTPGTEDDPTLAWHNWVKLYADNATLIPNTDNAYDIGASDKRFVNVYAQATSALYADLAEKYTIDEPYEIGDVVLISPRDDIDIEVANRGVIHTVLGVVSENPAFKMNDGIEGPYIALRGRVKCKVFGKIRKGDRLVSWYNGCAIKHTNGFFDEGIVFAKALENKLTSDEGLIEVVIL